MEGAMKNRIAVVCGLSLALFASQAWAAPTQHQLDLAKRYMTATHLLETVDNSMRALRPMLMGQLGSQLTAEQSKVLNEAMDVSYKRFLDTYFARVEPIFAETFSERELTELVAFYESPTGQSLIAKTPQIQA